MWCGVVAWGGVVWCGVVWCGVVGRRRSLYLLSHPTESIPFGRADLMLLLLGASFVGFIAACIAARWTQRWTHGVTYIALYVVFVFYCFAVN